MFRFANPAMLYLLLVIPALVGIYWLLRRARAKRLARFGDEQILRQLMPDYSPIRLRNKFILWLIAFGLLVFAMARPQHGSKLRETKTEGAEIIFVLDVSNSMLAQDFEPNRLERTKYAIIRLLENMKQDRVGLVVFAGDAYVQLPVTGDYVAARNFITQANPSMVSKQGTAIGAAIDLAASSFSSDSEGSRIIILISDGENHEDNPIAAAESAAAKGITIYSIGVGTPEGSPIMINGQYMKDHEGNMVVTKLDENMLSQVALLSGGAYIRASNRSVGLSEIMDQINEVERTTLTAHVFDEYEELFRYPLIASLVLLIINMLMLSRRNRVLARFNIFGKTR